MITQARTQPLVQIADPDFQVGFEEAQEPNYANCGIRTDIGLVEVVRAMLTEYAIEKGLLSSSYGAAPALSLGY